MQPGSAGGQPVQRPPRKPDARPLYRRKRVWLGGFGLFILGSALVSIGDHAQVTQAEALVKARPTVTATATVDVRVTATAKPTVTPTVTMTATATSTATATATVTAPAGSGSDSGSASSGGSSSGGSSSGGSAANSGGGATCSLTSSSGNCYRAGEFCPKRDLGLTTTDVDGNQIKCEDDNGYNRWMYG